MEAIKISADAARYDEVLRTSSPECGDLEIIFKNAVTRSGSGGVVITFTTEIDGKKHRVQAVATAANFIRAGHVVEGFAARNVSQN